MNKKLMAVAAMSIFISTSAMAESSNGLSQQAMKLENKLSVLEEQMVALVELQRCHSMPQANVDWHGCDKRNMEGGYDGAPLWRANLINSDLRGVNFSGVSIIYSLFTGANLEGVDFTNASLAYSNLIGANVNNVIWQNTTCPDETNSDENGYTCDGHLLAF